MITMFVEIKNMKRFYFFILLIILPFSSQAKINQPYGLFFVQENELKEGQDIFEVPTLKTLISVEVQGLLTTTTVKQYFINPTNTLRVSFKKKSRQKQPMKRLKNKEKRPL